MKRRACEAFCFRTKTLITALGKWFSDRTINVLYTFSLSYFESMRWVLSTGKSKRLLTLGRKLSYEAMK